MYDLIVVTSYRTRHAGKWISYFGALLRGWGNYVIKRVDAL
jgi:hypothetical protein